jgi:hypothetical protein
MLRLIVILAAATLSPPHPDHQSLSQSWSCTPRKLCTQIASCDEARWYLQNCAWGPKLDADNDGSPCERLCGNAQ